MCRYDRARSTMYLKMCVFPPAARMGRRGADGRCPAAWQVQEAPGPAILDDYPGPGTPTDREGPIMSSNDSRPPRTRPAPAESPAPGDRRRAALQRGIAAMLAALEEVSVLEEQVARLSARVSGLEDRSGDPPARGFEGLLDVAWP